MQIAPEYRILCVVGARPNFMKIAPIMSALACHAPAIAVTLLHTGQHYDVAMNQQYFDALGLPAPDINLEVGSGSHAYQTAQVMLRFEPVLDALSPSAVLVVGDVNSTLACALVAAKKAIPVIHVEAGLRSFDRAMPEEVNRVLTDQLAALLFTTESSARDNLLKEGIAQDRIQFVGNVMIDTLLRNLKLAVPLAKTIEQANRLDFLGCLKNSVGHAVLTLHRPSNVDDPDTLKTLLETVSIISKKTPVIFPIHPRTRAVIESCGFAKLLDSPYILLLPPLGYLEMLGLMKDARVVLTDSGGIQEETTALGVACLTLRNNTERPVTVTEGTNTVVGQDSATILAAYDELMQSGGKTGRIPQFWDGKASVRIAGAIAAWINRGCITS
jgi:UDP-N-acetylglucosamine 2-epimerase (non-hydrolysing)